MTLPNGTVGALVHVDLANRASCVAVATEDLRRSQFNDGSGGLVLIGRESGAALRGFLLARRRNAASRRLAASNTDADRLSERHFVRNHHVRHAALDAGRVLPARHVVVVGPTNTVPCCMFSGVLPWHPR